MKLFVTDKPGASLWVPAVLTVVLIGTVELVASEETVSVAKRMR